MDFNKGIVKAITMYHTATRGEYANYNNISGVYIIKNTITNKIYIGSSNNLGNRISKHFSECKHNRHPNRLFQLDFDKHSQSSFVFNIELITNNYKDEEYKLQLKYDKDILYNNSIGGKLSTQHKNAVGIANTKWVRDDEYRSKLSKAKTKYSIVQLDRKGNILDIFNTVHDIIIKHPTFKTQPVRAVCNKGKSSYRGYIWRYVIKGKEDEFVADFKYITSQYREVFTIVDNKIKTFKSLGEAANYCKGKVTNIQHNCKHNSNRINTNKPYLRVRGYVWFYKEDLHKISL